MSKVSYETSSLFRKQQETKNFHAVILRKIIFLRKMTSIYSGKFLYKIIDNRV